jgi:hypothetical protein
MGGWMGPRASLDGLEKTAFYLFIHPSLDLSIHPLSSLFITLELYKTNLNGMHLSGNIEIDQECCFTSKQTFWINKLLVNAAMQ